MYSLSVQWFWFYLHIIKAVIENHLTLSLSSRGLPYHGTGSVDKVTWTPLPLCQGQGSEMRSSAPLSVVLSFSSMPILLPLQHPWCSIYDSSQLRARTTAQEKAHSEDAQ